MTGAPGSRPVRLLLVVDSLEVGGAERHVVDLAVALRHKGYDEVTVACSVAGDLSGVLERAGVPTRPLVDRLAKRRLSVAYAWRLRKLLRRERFDLVHAHIYASVVAAAIATLGKSPPLVITEHTEALWQDWRARRVSQWVYRRAKHIIAVSAPIRRRLIERDSVPPDLITVVPNAVVSPEAHPDASLALPAELRERPLVGVVARLHPDKGVANFLKAAARVAPLFPEAHFVVVGDGPLRQELVTLAGDLGLGNHVHFLGFRSDGSALMNSLDVLVVPSLTEGSPLVTLEAMAAGVPVVASAVGGIPDQVRHDKEGLLIPPGDTDALGDALLDLLRDPARAHRLGEAGRQRATSQFNHATMVRRIEDVYRTVLGRPAVQSVAPEEPELRTTR